jgi:hypothetical protein
VLNPTRVSLLIFVLKAIAKCNMFCTSKGISLKIQMCSNERKRHPHMRRHTYWRKLVSTGIVSEGKLMLHLDYFKWNLQTYIKQETCSIVKNKINLLGLMKSK